MRAGWLVPCSSSTSPSAFSKRACKGGIEMVGTSMDCFGHAFPLLFEDLTLTKVMPDIFILIFISRTSSPTCEFNSQLPAI